MTSCAPDGAYIKVNTIRDAVSLSGGSSIVGWLADNGVYFPSHVPHVAAQA